MNKAYMQKKIKELFIVQENDGSYNLFGTYMVKPQTNGGFKVFVIDGYDAESIEFSSLKYAVTWCVFEKNNKHKERERLYTLDQLINSLEVTMFQNKKLAEKVKSPDRYIYLAKFLEDKLKKKKAIQEIEQYTSLSRYIQDKKFTEIKGVN
jgi:hypothetical protein